MTSAGQQLITLGWMVVTGQELALLRPLPAGPGLASAPVVLPPWETAFLALRGQLTFGVLLQVNFGEVRSYIFLGIFLGLFSITAC